MRVVTRMTGLSADVVRVWERRHAAIEPDRTAGNARRYSAADIRRLERLRDAVAAGHSIGSIARLGEERLADLAKQRVTERPEAPVWEPYLAAIGTLELARAEAILARQAQLLGAREMVHGFVAPLLREVGDRWHAGRLSVAEEHAVSAQVRAILATLMRTTSLPPGAPRLVLATPPGQRHELGVQMAAVLAAEQGVAPVYLGADLPFEDMVPACASARAQVLTLSALIAPADIAARRAEALAVRRVAAQIELWIGGPSGHPLHRVRGVRGLVDFHAFEAALAHRFGTVRSVAALGVTQPARL